MRVARALVAGSVAALLLAGCTAGTGADPDDPAAQATAAVTGFLDRWAAGEKVRPLVAETDERLQVSDTSYELAGEATCGERRCRQRVRLTHRLAGLGPWSYRTTVTVDRPAADGGAFTVRWTPQTLHPALTDRTRLSRERELPPRASILDRDGRRLTRNGDVARVGVVPGKIGASTYADLERLLDLDTTDLRTQVEAAGPDWFVPVINLRSSDYDPVADRLLRVPGVAVDPDVWSLPPSSTWGRALLGSVAPATEETLPAAGPLASPADVVGSGGLQLEFQRRLAGRPGGSVQLVDAESGATVERLARFAPQPGRDLRTTLDYAVQDAAEQAVQAQSKLTALVAVQAGTGEVLASAVGPGITSYNTAFVGQYPPGSTFKAVSTAALLDADAVRLQEPARCPPTTTVEGKSFKNYDDFEALPPDASFADAFAASCNTAIVSRASRLDDDALAAMARRFGVGDEWDLGVDAFSGDVPTTTGVVDRAASMIGQGRVLMSPLAMATVAAGIASGTPSAPVLLSECAGAGPAYDPLPTGLAGSLRSLLRLVVTQGTADELDLPGAPVHAKTGTAEFDSDDPSKTHAWMIGFRGDLAFAVLVEEGASGSEDAAPVVRSFLESVPAS